MDLNSFLDKKMISIGSVRILSNKMIIQLSKRKIILNSMCSIVSLFCCLKMLVILTLSWEKINIPLYGIELYIFRHNFQKFFYVGLFLLHFAVGYAFRYWNELYNDQKRFECLRFLFTINVHDIITRYNLERKEVNKFVKVAEKIRHFLIVLMFLWDILFFLFVLRSTYLSWWEVSFKYFLMFSVPFTVATLFAYHNLAFGILSTYACYFISIKFLELCISALDANISTEFNPRMKQSRNKKDKKNRMEKIIQKLKGSKDEFSSSDEDGEEKIDIEQMMKEDPRFCQIDERIGKKGLFTLGEIAEMKEQKKKKKDLRIRLKNVRMILTAIQGFVKQHHEINQIFDHLLSMIFVDVLLCGLVFPYFGLMEIPLAIKVFTLTMYPLAVFVVGYSLIYFNESFVKKIDELVKTIHYVMPLFKGTHLKLNFLNFLTLRNEHKIISFTFLRTFDFASHPFFEYLMHSISFIFMIYQALNLTN